MSFSLKSNAEAVARRIERNDPIVIKAMQNTLLRQMRRFESHTIRTQMTGRPGLRSQTGALRGDWRVRSGGHARDFWARMSNTPKTWYALVHQHAEGFTGWIRAKTAPYLRFNIPGVGWRQKREVFIPKRLHIPEAFFSRGNIQEIRTAMFAAALKAARTR